MTSISTAAAADAQRRAKSQIAQPFARSRPHLPDAGGAAAPRRHPLYLFRSHRPEVILRLRHDRARHRQFLHGDVLLPVGPVRVAGHRAQGTAELSARSPVSAWPAVRDLRVHGHSARLLRHLAAAASRDRLFATFWWKTDHRRTRGRADRSGSFGSCSASTWLPACCIGCHPTCSIRSIAFRCTVAAGPPCSSRSCLPSPLRSTFPGGFTSDQAAGSSSGRSRSSTGA